MKPDSSAIPQEMEQARQQPEAWRNTHRPRCHIPDGLRKRAAELASQHGLYLTSPTLRVDYMQLKRLVQPASPERKSAELPGFVELKAPAAAGIPECVVELEGTGGRMRIQMKGIATAELVGMSRMVWADPTCSQNAAAQSRTQFNGKGESWQATIRWMAACRFFRERPNGCGGGI
jgi:hypothetical protein